jgi:hypothetical protein
LEKPTNPDADADETDKAIWAEEFKEYVKRTPGAAKQLCHHPCRRLGTVQRGNAGEDQVPRTDYTKRTDKNDCFWLLKQIKSVTLQFDETKYGFISIMDARANLLNCRQGQEPDRRRLP